MEIPYLERKNWRKGSTSMPSTGLDALRVILFNLYKNPMKYY